MALEGTPTSLIEIKATISGPASLTGNVVAPKGIGGDTYTGPYEILPSTSDDVVLETKRMVMSKDVTVFKIPYYETSNTSGYTVYIASEV